MELWLLARTLSSRPNPDRPFSSHTLHFRYRNSLLLRRPHLPRRQLRLTYPEHTCQRCIFLLHLHLSSHRTRLVLRLLLVQRNMKHWGDPPPPDHNNSLRGLRPSLRTNIILRCNRHHKSSLCSSLHRQLSSPVNLRGLLCR